MSWKSGFADLYELHMLIGHWVHAKMGLGIGHIWKGKGCGRFFFTLDHISQHLHDRQFQWVIRSRPFIAPDRDHDSHCLLRRDKRDLLPSGA